MKNTKKYGFYAKSDESAEFISKGCFRTEEEATEYWSKIKRLTLKKFNELYIVKNIEESRDEDNS